MPTQFDMFSDEPPAGSEPALRHSIGRSITRQMTEAEMVAQLTASGRYRILRKLEPRETAAAVRPGFALKGIILDTETTGLKHRNEENIEIGLIAFTFDERGEIGDVTGVYCGLQQPNKPIPAEITKLTGIMDEMVSGQMVDMQAVRALVAPAMTRPERSPFMWNGIQRSQLICSQLQTLRSAEQVSFFRGI